jgi:hypothetical protein
VVCRVVLRGGVSAAARAAKRSNKQASSGCEERGAGTASTNDADETLSPAKGARPAS